MAQSIAGVESRLKVSLLYAGLFVSGGVCPLLCSPPVLASQNEIRIGKVLPLSGPEAPSGNAVRRGVSLAIEEANLAGGVRGLRVRAVAADDGGSEKSVAGKMKALLDGGGVSVVIGSVGSARSAAMAAVAQERRVPMIAPSSTHPKVTREGDYAFRACFVDSSQGRSMADFARQDLRASRAAVLRESGNEYSGSLASEFQRRFSALGGTIEAVLEYKSGQVDFNSLLSPILNLALDIIYVPGYYSDIGMIARQARAVGIRAKFAGGDGWDSPKTYELGGEAVEGSYYSTHFSSQRPTPVVERFVAAFRARYGAEPGALSALGYDAARLALDAISRAATLSGPDVRDALAGTEGFSGVTGTISFRNSRDPAKTAFIMKLKDGGNRFVAAVAP